MSIRKQRTKEAIKQAYLEWILTNNRMPHVKELAEHLNINRGTFYLHYADVYSLLDELEDDSIMEIRNIFLEYQAKDASKLIAMITEHIQSNFPVFKVLLSPDSQAHYVQKLIREMKKLVPHSPAFAKIEDNEVRDYLATFIFAGSISVFANWIRDNSTMPPQEIIKKMYRFFTTPFEAPRTD